nr:MFS transporter [Pseudonocardia sp. ICBG601]
MTTTPSRTEQVPASRTGALIAVLVGAAFVMILNETVLSVALRDLSVDLGVPATTTQWLTSGFLLTMAVVIPTTGYLLDRFTPRQVFLASLGLFTVGTAVAGFAPGFAMLLVGRIVQAGGTAMMIPLLMTTILRLVPAERRGATMGTITIVIAVAPAIGPTIGGAILSGLGWRWMFLAGPAAGRARDGGRRPVAAHRRRRPPGPARRGLGAAVPPSGSVGWSTGCPRWGGHGGGGLPPWVPVVGGAGRLAVFVLRQLRLMRDGRALLDLRPFRRRQFVVALVLTALVLLSLIGVAAVLLPLYLQTVLGTSTLVSGLVVLPGGLLLGLLGRPVGAVRPRRGPAVGDPGRGADGGRPAAVLHPRPGPPLGVVVAFHLVLMGGLALMMTPLMTEALGSLPDELYSHGSAILSTLQQVAGALGTALFVTVAALGSAAAGASPDASGLHAAFAVAGGGRGAGRPAVATGPAPRRGGDPGRPQAGPAPRRRPRPPRPRRRSCRSSAPGTPRRHGRAGRGALPVRRRSPSPGRARPGAPPPARPRRAVAGSRVSSGRCRGRG